MDKPDLAAEAVKAAPPVSVTTLTLFGIPLDQWVYIVTVMYTCLQILVLYRDKLGGRELLGRVLGWLRFWGRRDGQ